MNAAEVERMKNRLDPESEAQLLTVSQNKYDDILKAKREELKLMINLTQPEYLVPVHGSYAMRFEHAE